MCFSTNMIFLRAMKHSNCFIEEQLTFQHFLCIFLIDREGSAESNIPFCGVSPLAVVCGVSDSFSGDRYALFFF